MSTKKPTEDLGTTAVPDQSAEQLSSAGNARRRFAKRAGLGSTGVLLTLTSQPGMAALVCKSPSRNMSVMASTHPGEVIKCSGMGPKAWCYSSAWPCIKDTTTFGRTFPCNNSNYSSLLLKDILANTGTDMTSAFGRALVATYLNVQSQKINFLTLEDVVSMYTEVQSTYQYKPTATIVWTIPQLTEYLVSTYSGE